MLTYQTMLGLSGLDRSDAHALLHHLTGHGRAWLIAHDQDPVPADLAQHFADLAQRRTAGEPVAYLLGEREFYSLSFAVTPAVLIPRPDTELIVELALERIAPGQAAHVLDLGTGSGVIAITVAHECPSALVTAADISTEALAVAQINAQRHAPRVQLVHSDWFAAIPRQRFDLILSNPPYIERADPHLVQGDLRFEPRSALTDEADGLAHIRRIIVSAPEWLLPQGWLLFEHGFDQGLASRDLLLAAGFRQVQTWTDLAGLDRVSGGLAPQAVAG